MARAVFRTGYRPHALDISVVPTPDRPPLRGNDEHFGDAARARGVAGAQPRRSCRWTGLTTGRRRSGVSGAAGAVRRRPETIAVRRLRGAYGEGAARVRALRTPGARSHGGATGYRFRRALPARRGALLEPVEQGEDPGDRVPDIRPRLGVRARQVQEDAPGVVHGAGVRRRRRGGAAPARPAPRRGARVDAARVQGIRRR